MIPTKKRPGIGWLRGMFASKLKRTEARSSLSIFTATARQALRGLDELPYPRNLQIPGLLVGYQVDPLPGISF